MKKIILSAVVLIAAFSAAKAQSTSTVNQTVTLTLQNSIAIAITAATGTGFLFDDVTEFQNGITNTNASTFQVKSNKPWNVTVKAGAGTFSGPAATVMPSTVLGVRMNGGSTFNSLTTTAVALTTGLRGINSFNIDYNAAPGYLYDAGAYTLTVVYTATQL